MAVDLTNENVELSEYVISNIDEAVKNEWIKVYYQPVIRSLTNRLCGCESLARWIDPVHGFLPPGKFIGALEKSRQIHKLDCFIIEKACEDISCRLKNNLPVVPVSINFSRLDFETVDMLDVLEEAVEKNDIPRDFIHIEITESMIVSDAELMRSEIERFRNAGYEVWMDDFGSAYSSLNLLKDYTFDTLKLDMGFLSSFTDKSKAIVTSIITMAKNIGVKTLAEGVETEEQAAFLKKIGCARLQGYFYGKPMPVSELFSSMEEKNIEVEERQWRHYYDVASFNAIESDESLELLEHEGSKFHTLFMNDIFKEQILDQEHPLEDIDRVLYNEGSPLTKKYREFAKVIEKTKNLETFYYTYNGNILCLKAKELAVHKGRHLLKGSLINISMDQKLIQRNHLDYRLKEINHLFDVVIQINPGNNTAVPLLGRFKYNIGTEEEKSSDYQNRLTLFKKNYLYPEDKEKFDEFTEVKNVRERVEASSKGYIDATFRLKQEDGNYKWKEFYLMMIPGTSGNEYLVCIKSLPENVANVVSDTFRQKSEENASDAGGSEALYPLIWKNIVHNSNIMYFWKDKERRFLGANKSFLEFYGFDSLEDILGKTDEDLHWNVDETAYKSDEVDVIEKGTIVRNAPGQCIVNGVVHNIVCNKIPFYKDEKIIGLIGYFMDCDEEYDKSVASNSNRKTDPITGIMNARTFVDTMIDYAQEYHDNNKDYGLIIFRNTKYERIVEEFGIECGHALLKKIAQEIIAVTGQSCAVARTKEADFALLISTNNEKVLIDLAKEITTKVESIRQIDGNSITIRFKSATVLRSLVEFDDENIYQYTLNMLDS